MKTFRKKKPTLWLVPLIAFTSVGFASADSGNRDLAAYDLQSSTSMQTSAYGSKRSPLGLDFHVGTSFANLNGVDSSGFSGMNLSNKLGVDAGIGLDLAMSRVLSVHPELNYVQKGLSMSASGNDGFGDNYTVNGTINLNYVELPLLLKAQTTNRGVRPNLFAGPEVGYLVTGSESDTMTFGGQRSSENQDLGSLVKRWDYGVLLGAGASIPAGRNNAILADLSYDLGMANINNDGTGTVLKNRALTFTLGFRI